jgi:hypothetical protein
MPPPAPARVVPANIHACGPAVGRDPDRLSVGTRLQPSLCLVMSTRGLRLPEIGPGKFPVDNLVQHGMHVVRPPVLVVEVIRVFPHVNRQQRSLMLG